MNTVQGIGGVILSASLANPRYGTVQGSRLNPLTNSKESFQGQLFEWASNVSHLEDTAVTVEDLSDINIEHQNTSVQRLLDTLGPSLKDDVSTPCHLIGHFLDDYQKHKDDWGVIIEDFSLNNFKVHRRTYPMFDAKDGKPKEYGKGDRAQHIEAEAKKRARLDNLEQDGAVHAIGRIVFEDQKKPEGQRRFLNKDGKLKKQQKESWPLLKAAVHGRLFQTRIDPEGRSELLGDVETIQAEDHLLFKSSLEMASQMYESGTKWEENRHNDYLIDVEAAELCDEISGKDIVILRDKNHELIAGVITNATQRLFPSTSSLLERMDLAARAFAWRYPYVVCGVEHYGLHTEKIASGLPNLKFQKFSQAKWGPGIRSKAGAGGDSAWQEEFPKVLTGLYGLATKQLRESLSRWDPDLHAECVKLHNSFPLDLQLSSVKDGQNPYSSAQLVDPLTEGHRDTTDLKHGLAGIATFGDFDQGGDLVLKELGVRIPFP
ncbi:hypothetical protein PG993_011943 [Apiospora rasikravindrae]|uniref:Uncharacterized protein n=1 Tax=Apiospora rasikravindrae TaxID=990691 RepID=A0ABR1S116_9PEZI